MDPNPTPNTDWVAIISAVGAAVAAILAAWQSAISNQRSKENKIIIESLDPKIIVRDANKDGKLEVSIQDPPAPNSDKGN